MKRVTIRQMLNRHPFFVGDSFLSLFRERARVGGGLFLGGDVELVAIGDEDAQRSFIDGKILHIAE